MPAAVAGLRRLHRRACIRLGVLPTALAELALLAGVLLLPLVLLEGWLSGAMPMQWMAQLHTAAEVGCTAITLMVFFLTWNTRRWGQPTNLVAAGAGFLGVSVLGVLHLLVYPGMPGMAMASSLNA